MGLSAGSRRLGHEKVPRKGMTAAEISATVISFPPSLRTDHPEGFFYGKNYGKVCAVRCNGALRPKPKNNVFASLCNCTHHYTESVTRSRTFLRNDVFACFCDTIEIRMVKSW